MSADVALAQAPAPCPVLSDLYRSKRPAASLLRGVHLAPIILSCSLPTTSQAMLAENWTSKAVADAEAPSSTAAAPPAFNPAAPEYNELARRVSQSSAMQRWNELTILVKQLEKQLSGLTGEAKEAKQQEIYEAQQQLADAQAALSDLQASFEPDPLSLVPWMSALFALADAGCSSFDTGGAGWPPSPGQAPLTELLGGGAGSNPAAASAWLYGGAELVLGVFKRRYEAERGPGKLSIFTRLAINCFGDATPAQLAAAVETAVERSRNSLLGAEAVAAGSALDLVQLHWLDYKEHDFLPVLLALSRLARDRYESGPEGCPMLAEAKRVAGIGLVDAPADAIIAALRAGVPLACVTVPYNLLDVSAAPLLQLCCAKGIKVFAAGALAHGLISETFLGVAAPNSAAAASGSSSSSSSSGGSTSIAAEAMGPDNLTAGMRMVARYGGWTRFQLLLQCLKKIADKHSVSVEAVALRWLIDQGTFPVTAARWSASAGPWATFGHTYGLLREAAAAAAQAIAGHQTLASSGEAGTEGKQVDGEQQSDETAAVAAAEQGTAAGAAAAPVLGGCEPFVPGVDAALFQVASFLDAADVAALGALCGAAA